MKNSFRTIFTPQKYPIELDYDSKIMFIGSCFSENIGQKLESYKFNVDINPFGILYNPVSIKNSLNLMTRETFFTDDDLFYNNERWHSFFHHSRFSGADKGMVLQNINLRLKKSSKMLFELDYLFITFGTSAVYEYIETGEIVSNCHKVPTKKFNAKLLNPEEIIVEYFQLINKLINFNPKLKIVFTVSPVRHLKDGFINNQLSKSILIYSINRIKEEYSNVFYFPAYEIVNDDLRDYRFYNEDMLHVNKTAINYLFDFFEKSFFSEETIYLKNAVLKLYQAYSHKPFNDKSQAFIDFSLKNIIEIEKIEKKIGSNRLKIFRDYFKSFV